jgi:hypothetical protein
MFFFFWGNQSKIKSLKQFVRSRVYYVRRTLKRSCEGFFYPTPPLTPSLSLSLSPAPKIIQKIVHRLQSQWRIKTNFRGRNRSCPLHHVDDDNLPIRFLWFREFDGTCPFLDLCICFNFSTCRKSGYQWSRHKVKGGRGFCMHEWESIIMVCVCFVLWSHLSLPKTNHGTPLLCFL